MLTVPTLSLQPAPWNPRRIAPAARQRLRAGIERFGFVQPVIAREEDRLIVGGHQRWDIAVELQLATVPVIFLSGLTDARAKALAVLLNNKDAQGEWEMSSLTALLEELAVDPLEELLSATGFEEGSLEKLLGTGASDAAVLTPLEVRPLPKMVWVLIGAPSGQYAEIADRVQQIATVSGILCEVVSSDHGATA
jgi:ParB-like chromosome segregation protein Spo0J